MAETATSVRRLLDASPGVATPRLHLLDFDVEMRVPDAALAAYLTDLYAPMTGAGPAEHVLTLSASGPADGSGPWSVHLDATRVLATPALSVAFRYLLWEANRQAIDATSTLVTVHASAAVSDGIAIVLPGPMGAGKSTLVAALVREGFDYLTDEVVAIDPSSGLVRPYPKYLSLDASSAELGPEPPSAVQNLLGDERLVTPEAIRPGSIASPAPPRLVVVPRYERDATTAVVEEMRPAEALSALAEHAFHIEAHGQRTLDVLAGVVAASACFRLVSGSVADATAALLGLVADVRSSVPS